MLVSIVMTVRNEEAYLDECLRSIHEQRLQDWELHVIDDHSSDATVNILKEWSIRDKRIKWEKNRGKGIIAALSQAQELSNGELITRMDGDDLMPPQKLDLLKNVLLEKGRGTMVSGKVRYFSNDKVSIGYRTYEEWLNDRVEHQDHAKWVYRECVCASPNWMCFREDLEAIGGFMSLNYPEDYDLVLKWHAAGFLFHGLNSLTHLWREHPERTSRNSEIYEQTSFYKLKIPYLVNAFPGASFFILGKGQKSRLTAQLLKDLNIDHSIADDPADPNLSEKLNESYSSASILLLAAFPPAEERIQLERLVKECGYEIGTNCFYI